MARILPWTSVEVGDLDVFAPAIPCLFVYTWYVDGEPDSTVSYLWQDDDTGAIHHELLLNAPVAYDVALKWAMENAPVRNVERIHVKHARLGRPARGVKRKTASAATSAADAARSRKAIRSRAGSRTGGAVKSKRKVSSRKPPKK